MEKLHYKKKTIREDWSIGVNKIKSVFLEMSMKGENF